ncbi:hypothetical protein RhiirA4_471014 [Rhizophagus irregularis]|uniref:Uncharacterized protein n=1 Tax=Rhizophagus irregularis TaxID=588596 RepID=A0A2I1H2B1_9GLOM|nr:hypothetical protein RhiirA4_471014 [Rhizophagus irregularis]
MAKICQYRGFRNTEFETKILQLSEAIERKASTLIKLVIAQVLISSKFFSSLTNLVYLKFISSYYNNNKQELQELQSIRNDHNFEYTKRLYKAIAINCPKIETLSINTQFKNLGDIEDEKYNCPKTFKVFLFNEDFIFSID